LVNANTKKVWKVIHLPEDIVATWQPDLKFQKLHEIGEIATNNAFSLERPTPQAFLWILACEWVLKKFCHPIPRVYPSTLSLKCLLPLLEKISYPEPTMAWVRYCVQVGLSQVF
jgi:hypothetical protein